MKKVIISITLFSGTLISCDAVLDRSAGSIQEIAERAYFEGQRDAIDGDVRIRLNNDSCYEWIKSPWDNGRSPIYNPTYLDTKDGN